MPWPQPRQAEEYADTESGEERLIARYFKPLATHPGALGLIDDAAVVGVPSGHDLVLKTDAIIGGVHFWADDPPEGWRRRRSGSISRISPPRGRNPPVSPVDRAAHEDRATAGSGGFASGARRRRGAIRCPLFGGDTDRTPGPVTISISAFGTVPQRHDGPEKTARKPGDRLVVTGAIGDAAVGLVLRRDGGGDALGTRSRDAGALLPRYLVPEPRNAIAEALRRHAHGGDGRVRRAGRRSRQDVPRVARDSP